MKKIYIGILVILLSILSGCLTVSNENRIPKQNVYFVSMLQLISKPSFYSGKKISVSGIFSFVLEDNSLYYSKEAYEYHIFQSSLDLMLHDDIYDNKGKAVKEKIDKIDEKYKKYHGKWVKLKGTFLYVPKDPLRPYRMTDIDQIKIVEKTRR